MLLHHPNKYEVDPINGFGEVWSQTNTHTKSERLKKIKLNIKNFTSQKFSDQVVP